MRIRDMITQHEFRWQMKENSQCDVVNQGVNCAVFLQEKL